MTTAQTQPRKTALRSKALGAFKALRSIRPRDAVNFVPHVRKRTETTRGWATSMKKIAQVVTERRGRKRTVLKRIVGLTVSAAATLSLAPLSYLAATLCPEGSAAGRNSTMDMIGNAPSNAMSRWIGKFCGSRRIPPSVHQRLIRVLIRTYGIDISQIERPISSYSTLQEFFCRKLAPGSRPIHSQSILVSPCDGELLQLGTVTDDDMIVQVKGDKYSITELMRTSRNKFSPPLPGTKRWFFLFHLRPKDYHRFHSPATWTIDEAVHIPGTLHPVTSTANKWIPGLFARNERVSVIGRWQYGTIGFVPVGATCVGSISLCFDERIRTNRTSSITNIWSLFRFASGQDTSAIDGPDEETIRSREEKINEIVPQDASPVTRRRLLEDIFPELDRSYFHYGTTDESPLKTAQRTQSNGIVHDDRRPCPSFAKGDELGWFNWGSAIALIVDLPESMRTQVCALDEVRVGQPLVSW